MCVYTPDFTDRTRPGGVMSKPDQKALLRATLERLDPAVLKFMDMAKVKFGAKLVGLSVTENGVTTGMGGLKNDPSKK